MIAPKMLLKIMFCIPKIMWSFVLKKVNNLKICNYFNNLFTSILYLLFIKFNFNFATQCLNLNNIVLTVVKYGHLSSISNLIYKIS